MEKSRLVAFSVGRGLQPRAIETAVMAGNGGALGRRRGGGEKKGGRTESIMSVSMSSDAVRMSPWACIYVNTVM